MKKLERGFVGLSGFSQIRRRKHDPIPFPSPEISPIRVLFLESENPFRSNTKIEHDIAYVNAFDPIDGFKIAQSDLHAVFPTSFQKPVIKPLAIPDAVAATVETKQWNQNHVDLIRRNCFIVPWFVNFPRTRKQFSSGRVSCRFHLTGFNIYSRNDGPYLRSILPDRMKNYRSVDLIEFLDRNEAVKNFDGCKIEMFKEVICDASAFRRPLGL